MFFMFFVAAICLISVLIYGFVQLDKVTAFEQAHYPDEWAADGFPDGFFRRPNGLFGEYVRPVACALVWLFLTPDWIRQHASTKLWLRRFRLCALVWNVGVLAMVWAGSLPYAALKPTSASGTERSVSVSGRRVR